MVNNLMRLPYLSLIACISLLMAHGTAAGAQVLPYKPFDVDRIGLGGEKHPAHVRSDVLSARYSVKVSGIEVPAVQYDNTGFGDQGHNMDVARFASDLKTPVVEITLLDGDMIDSVTVHPVRYYPKSVLTVDKDRRTLRFTMAEALPYAIVAMNGGDPQDAYESAPQLTIINDPIESEFTEGPNVLNFADFAKAYLKKHPIRDKVGAVCRKAGAVTDNTLNDDREFTWNHGKGTYKAYESRIVAFPDKRARNRNDVSEALQAALEEIQRTPGLNTLYIPAGVYLWSGLRVENWNGDPATGGKPLRIHTDKDALMVNRLKECREANEPAVFIFNSSYVTLTGRGMHDGQGCYTFAMDRKDARNTPHQGGVVVRKSHDITLRDTYSRDAQQWNYETHDVEDVVFRNIHGLSPYNHGWIDGLNLSSGKNVTVDGAITLGNDDTFASGHYNPSNEFPVRTYRENPGVNLGNTDANPAELRNTFAAAGIYNKDRMSWSLHDTDNIRVSNTLGWTRTAHCIRIGLNTKMGDQPGDVPGRELRGFFFDNFNSVVGRKADGDIRILGFDSAKQRPVYKNISIRNSSFWKPSEKWARVETNIGGDNLVDTLTMENLYFVKPMMSPRANFSGVNNVMLENININRK